MSDIIIIGKGPAGISAALYTVRGGTETTIIGSENSSLAKAGEIENYYGFEHPISGEQLITTGIAQAERLGAVMIDEEVTGISYDGNFIVKTAGGEHTARSIILATGASRAKPKISGFDRLEGRGISFCSMCDAFFYRGKNVAVIGSGEYALHEAIELSQVVSEVTILTNGKEMTAEVPDAIKVITDEILAIEGENSVNGVTFKNGTKLDVAGVFIAIGVAGSSDLARQLGAYTEGSKIIVDDSMATTIPGLYACGDCTGGMFQVAKAVYEGAKAGSEAVKFLRKK